ncbi:hypothetical protein BDZ85DRAFT_86448 [Elsinoe ampelina]|uniref:Uncharacterized protein n=1 Tax=Elsinoe ampelina TaxID=302913 RepID=A0A6A6GGV8_9PEZI|nr:hypothetical protein BDZ85DRAFT_86448 [Elsinoe ampelina]
MRCSIVGPSEPTHHSKKTRRGFINIFRQIRIERALDAQADCSLARRHLCPCTLKCLFDHDWLSISRTNSEKEQNLRQYPCQAKKQTQPVTRRTTHDHTTSSVLVCGSTVPADQEFSLCTCQVETRPLASAPISSLYPKPPCQSEWALVPTGSRHFLSQTPPKRNKVCPPGTVETTPARPRRFDLPQLPLSLTLLVFGQRVHCVTSCHSFQSFSHQKDGHSSVTFSTDAVFFNTISQTRLP